jgi:hypothetical protein
MECRVSTLLAKLRVSFVLFIALWLSRWLMQVQENGVQWVTCNRHVLEFHIICNMQVMLDTE